MKIPKLKFITKRGVGFTFAAFALFVIGDVTRTGWVQVADALFWGALLASAVLAASSSGRIEAKPVLAAREGADGRVMQGQGALVRAEVVNNRPWPRFGVTIAYNLHINDTNTTERREERIRLHLPYLGPRERVTVEGVMKTDRRGTYRLGDGVAWSEAPFGLFRRSVAVKGDASLLVHPAPVDVELPPQRLVLMGERPRPVSARSGEESSGSRPFATGDAARDIHWRNSARAGRLMTKSYSATEHESPVLMVAPGGDSAEADLRLDDRCRVAAGVAFENGNQGAALSIVTGREPRVMTWAETSAYLASLVVNDMPSMEDQLKRLAPGASIVPVVDALDNESVAALVADAPRMGALDVWLLSEPDEETERRTSRVANTLRSVGAQVSIVERPLPAPEVTA